MITNTRKKRALKMKRKTIRHKNKTKRKTHKTKLKQTTRKIGGSKKSKSTSCRCKIHTLWFF